MSEPEYHCATASPGFEGARLDVALARLFPNYSRNALKSWILEGRVLVNGRPARPRDKVHSGDRFEFWPRSRPRGDWQAQPLELDIVHEDEQVLVLNKPPGLVVHPGAGNPDRTLLNALVHHDPRLLEVPRAGIVHRLDKDTSGLMVVARSLPAHAHLVAALKARQVKRGYEALVNGVLVSGGTIAAPIGRHPRQRTKMAVLESGKHAVSHYRVVRRFRAHTRIRVELESGRTHQIRVHLAHLGYPISGDSTYGGRPQLPPAASAQLAEALRSFRRQALHAASLSFRHPADGREVRYTAPRPVDFSTLLDLLGEDADTASRQDGRRT